MSATHSDSDVPKCLAKALRFLAHREHSRLDMSKKLLKAKFSQPVVDEVIVKLERLKYIDDARLARQIGSSAANHKSYGRRRAMLELTRRGIGRETAEAALTEIYSQVDSKDLARQIARKHAARLSRLDPQTARRRLAGLLQRRGFDSDSVQAVLARSFE